MKKEWLGSIQNCPIAVFLSVLLGNEGWWVVKQPLILLLEALSIEVVTSVQNAGAKWNRMGLTSYVTLSKLGNFPVSLPIVGLL
jgi:hypothetical protein